MKPLYNTSIRIFISLLSMLYLQKVLLIHLKKCVFYIIGLYESKLLLCVSFKTCICTAAQYRYCLTTLQDLAGSLVHVLCFQVSLLRGRQPQLPLLVMGGRQCTYKRGLNLIFITWGISHSARCQAMLVKTGR